MEYCSARFIPGRWIEIVLEIEEWKQNFQARVSKGLAEFY